MRTKEEFLEIMKRRYACKLFDTSRPLSDTDTSFILECARLSPSSFGLEHWHLFALRSPEKRAQLFSACLSQDAVGSAPLAVAAMCRRSTAYDPDASFVRERGSRFPGGIRAFVDDFRPYYEFLEKNKMLDHWARSQCYIACANMMTGAAAAGIESCAIEGYDNEAVLSVLGLGSSLWETGIITVFGYAAGADSREKIRMNESEIITHV